MRRLGKPQKTFQSLDLFEKTGYEKALEAIENAEDRVVETEEEIKAIKAGVIMGSVDSFFPTTVEQASNVCALFGDRVKT